MKTARLALAGLAVLAGCGVGTRSDETAVPPAAAEVERQEPIPDRAATRVVQSGAPTSTTSTFLAPEVVEVAAKVTARLGCLWVEHAIGDERGRWTSSCVLGAGQDDRVDIVVFGRPAQFTAPKSASGLLLAAFPDGRVVVVATN
jgi:hypothetical protein